MVNNFTCVLVSILFAVARGALITTSPGHLLNGLAASAHLWLGYLIGMYIISKSRKWISLVESQRAVFLWSIIGLCVVEIAAAVISRL